MRYEARERRKSAVKFYADTTAEGRTENGAKLRNPPPLVANNPDKSQTVCSEVEAAIQQWADDDQ